MANKILKHDHHIPKGRFSYPSILVEDDYPELLPLALSAIVGETGVPLIVKDGNGGLRELNVKVALQPSKLEVLLRLYAFSILVSDDTSIYIDALETLFERDDIPWMG